MAAIGFALVISWAVVSHGIIIILVLPAPRTVSVIYILLIQPNLPFFFIHKGFLLSMAMVCPVCGYYVAKP